MDDETKGRLKYILDLAYQEDWDNEVFSQKKAQICAELSENRVS